MNIGFVLDSAIHNILDEESKKVAVHAFVTSTLDNGNSLSYGVPKSQINKLQLVDNSQGSNKNTQI